MLKSEKIPRGSVARVSKIESLSESQGIDLQPVFICLQKRNVTQSMYYSLGLVYVLMCGIPSSHDGMANHPAVSLTRRGD